MSVEKNQLFKVGDKVKILPTILADYPDFPYVGAAGRVCTVTGNGTQIGVEFRVLAVTYTIVTEHLSRILAGGVLGAIWSLYLIICQIFGNILNKSEVLLEFN